MRFAAGEVIIDETLRDLEDEFGERFVRVHRNALIARHHIDGLVKDETGQMCIKLKGVEDLIEVSRRHLPSVRKLIKKL